MLRRNHTQAEDFDEGELAGYFMVSKSDAALVITKKLTGSQLRLWVYLMMIDPFADVTADGEAIYHKIPSPGDIAVKLGVNRRTVEKDLNLLRKLNLYDYKVTEWWGHNSSAERAKEVAKSLKANKTKDGYLAAIPVKQPQSRLNNQDDENLTAIPVKQPQSRLNNQDDENLTAIPVKKSSIHNKDHAHDQTYSGLIQTDSDSNQTESNSIQTPPLSPQGEPSESEEAVAVEVLNPEEPPTTSSQEPTNQSSSVASNENQSPDKNSGRRVATSKKKPKLTEQELQYFLDAYRAEKPNNFTNHQKLLDSHAKAINKLVAEYGDRSLEIFTAALTWVREQDNDWWRKDTFSLTNLMSNGKMLEYADKHFSAMENNRAYRDRVEGRAISKDKGRDNGFQVFNQDGEQVTGASAQVKAAIATDPMLQFFLGAK